MVIPERTRPPFVEKNIHDLTRQDINVAVSGMIINKGEGGFVVDDGTSQIQVLHNANVQEQKYVRVFGRILPFEEGLQLQGYFIQDLNRINKELHKKVKSMLNED